MSLLCCGLFATGLLMSLVGPRDTLDIHLYYTLAQAQLFLTQLSPEETRAYQYNELLDYGFMIVYSLIFLRGMQKAKFPKACWGLVLIPWGLDLIETTVILKALFHPEKELMLGFLGIVTFLKWTLGATLAIAIVMKYLGAKTHRPQA